MRAGYCERVIVAGLFVHWQASLAPGVGSTHDVDGLPTARLFEVLRGLRAATARLANNVDVFVRVDLVRAVRDVGEWDVFRALRAVDVPLLGFADVDNLGVFRDFSYVNFLHAPNHT